MHILVIQGEKVISELQFHRGPVYIGRQLGSQIYLPEKCVSRQHAVLYNDPKNDWLIEDLDSPNKTFLNDKAIHKSKIDNGDQIKICNFTLKLSFDSSDKYKKSMHLEDTIAGMEHDKPQYVIRSLTAEDSPTARVTPKRIKDFINATRRICGTNNVSELLHESVEVITKQFMARHAWVGILDRDGSTFSTQVGKTITGERVTKPDLFFSDVVDRVAKDNEYVLVPKIPYSSTPSNLRSAIIVPIRDLKTIQGVVCVDNTLDHEHYSMSDLEYLIFMSIQISAMLHRFS